MRVIALSNDINFRKAFLAFKPILSNLGLITIGCIIFAIGMNSVLIPDRLLSGGSVGIAMIHYFFHRWTLSLYTLF